MHIIIDTTWVLYRGYFSSKHIWEHFPELHFFCKLLNSYLSNKDNIIHLCIDGWNTKGKILLNDNYKAGRKKEDSYNVYTGLSTFVSLLDNNRIKIYYNKDYEADEIIYTLSHTLGGKKKILSADKDLLQAWDTINTTNTFYNPDKLTTNYFAHKHGIMAGCKFAQAIAFVKGATIS